MKVNYQVERYDPYLLGFSFVACVEDNEAKAIEIAKKAKKIWKTEVIILKITEELISWDDDSEGKTAPGTEPSRGARHPDERNR